MHGLFYYPWAFFALLLVPLIWWPWLRAGRRVTIRFSSVDGLRPGARTAMVRSRILLPILRTLAAIILIVCIARPQKADEQTKVKTEGVAIQLVLDRSGSMNQQDFQDTQGQPRTRLDVVKGVVREFIEGDNTELAGRPDDLVGLIAFARYADTECPMTHDHRHVLHALKNVQVPSERVARTEDGTAIGDALLLAVERIRSTGKRLGHDDAFKIKSRVIILLTDGAQNQGKYKPEEAAEAAAALGVKVYTIGAAPEFQEQTVGGFFVAPQTVRVPVTVDEETLKKVADMTGGHYFRARDAASLHQIYTEIDKLERSVVDETRYYLYDELALKPIEAGSIKLPPPLLAALCLMALEVLLVNTRFRKIP